MDGTQDNDPFFLGDPNNFVHNIFGSRGVLFGERTWLKTMSDARSYRHTIIIKTKEDLTNPVVGSSRNNSLSEVKGKKDEVSRLLICAFSSPFTYSRQYVRRLLQERNGNTQTTRLSSTQTRIPRIRTDIQSHFGNNFIHDGGHIRFVGDIVQFGGVQESFPTREIRPVFVVLYDDITVCFEHFVRHGDTIEFDGSPGCTECSIQRQRTN
jgi:hypothetical protein